MSHSRDAHDPVAGHGDTSPAKLGRRVLSTMALPCGRGTGVLNVAL